MTKVTTRGVRQQKGKKVEKSKNRNRGCGVAWLSSLGCSEDLHGASQYHLCLASLQHHHVQHSGVKEMRCARVFHCLSPTLINKGKCHIDLAPSNQALSASPHTHPVQRQLERNLQPCTPDSSINIASATPQAQIFVFKQLGHQYQGGLGKNGS